MISEINHQLSIEGIYIGAGEVSSIDARVIQAYPNGPNKDKSGNSKPTYGFKTHVNVDEDGFIKAMAFAASNGHDANHFINWPSGKASAFLEYRLFV